MPSGLWKEGQAGWTVAFFSIRSVGGRIADPPGGEAEIPSAPRALMNLSRRFARAQVQKNSDAQFAIEIRRLSELEARKIGDSLAHFSRVPANGRADGLQLLELAAKDRAGELIHAKVARGEGGQQTTAKGFRVGIAEHAGVVEPEAPLEELGIAGDHGPTLARGDGLALLEAVNANVANCTDVFPLVAPAHTLRTVLQHAELVGSGDFEDGVHVAGTSLEVDRHDYLGPRRDLRLDVLGIDIEGLVDLGEHRQRARKDDGIIAGVPGPGGQDYFVARPDPQGGHSGEQRRGPRGHAEGVFHANMGRVLFLELEDLRCASGRPAERIPRFENFEEFPLFDFIIELGPEVPNGKAGLPHRRSSIESEFLAFGGVSRHPSRSHENRRGAYGPQELTAGGHWLTH